MEFLYSFILHFFSGYKIAISIVRENESERKIVWDAQNSVHLKFFSFFFLFRPNNTIPLRWEEFFFFFVSVLFWYCLHTFTLNTFYGTTKQQKKWLKCFHNKYTINSRFPFPYIFCIIISQSTNSTRNEKYATIQLKKKMKVEPK